MTNNKWQILACLCVFAPISIEIALFIITYLTDMNFWYLGLFSILVPVFLLVAHLISKYKIKEDWEHGSHEPARHSAEDVKHLQANKILSFRPFYPLSAAPTIPVFCGNRRTTYRAIPCRNTLSWNIHNSRLIDFIHLLGYLLLQGINTIAAMRYCQKCTLWHVRWENHSLFPLKAFLYCQLCFHLCPSLLLG